MNNNIKKINNYLKGENIMSTPKTPIVCSNCNSTNVSYTEATMSGLDLINLVSGETKFNYHCQNCHNQGTKWA